jgi:hypothetical protein
VAVWLIVTKSLPYALAPSQPDLALALNSNNPAALVAKAEEFKKQLVALISVGDEQSKPEDVNPPETAANTLSRLPAVKGSAGGIEPVGEREALRKTIRDLAARAIANDPLNASAYRLLAEVTSGSDRVRLLMQQSLKRSRREAIAAFWLLNDSIYRKDFREALDYADILLRTRPALTTYVMGYLSLVAETPEARDLLVKKLESAPVWRRDFFEMLPFTSKNADTPLLITTALRESGKPVTQKEIAPYLEALVRNGQPDLAYNAWLQFLPSSQLENLGLLTNANFQSKPSGLPFDWQFAAGVNAISEIVSLEESKEHVLHIAFQDGRIKFPEVRQVLFLSPGRYRLSGKLHGAVAGKRGLRWQIHCTTGAKRILAETDMLLGESEQWRIFNLEAQVPAPNDCRGQTLRLFHDSRSASEELLSGEVWFKDLSLERVPTESGHWGPDP